MSKTSESDPGNGGRTSRRGRHTGADGGRRSRRPWMIALGSAAALVAGAAIALGLTAGNHPSISAAAPTSTAPTSPSGPTCPLTGEPAPGGQVPQRPAVAVKIDNYPTARPQSGLDKADVVFEEPVEGGITRFVAVFQCQSPSLVGPIRSARAVDAQILDQLNNPLFVHVGGIGPVLSIISNANDYNYDLGTHGSIVMHPTGRYAPYDTYTSTSSVWALRPSDTAPPAPLFTYSHTTPAGTAVTSIHIPYSPTNDVTWSWDANSGSWMLSYSGVPATVANGGQIGVPNIVVQTAQVTYGPWLENDMGGLEVQSQLVGSGPVQVFRNGVEVSGTWQRSSMDQTTQLVSSSGTPIALQPGQTWVEIVPSSIPVTTSSPSTSSSQAGT
jgi:Protein of unknown function (DUF3048) N-terminal domain/Protein of unknown function (DUF3048) C-terminal domain